MSAPLYSLTGDYAELQRRAEDGEDVSGALAAIDDALEVKAERIAAVLRGLVADQETLAAEIVRLGARKRSLENAEERLRTYVRDCMVAANITRIKSPKFTLHLAPSESVVVEDIDAVPPEYLHTPKPVEKAVAKKVVLDAHKKLGEIVPGCRVVVTKNLVIK